MRRMTHSRVLLSAGILFLLAGSCGLAISAREPGKPPAHRMWAIQHSGTDASLRGVSVAPISYTRGQTPFPNPVIWVSGSKGTILRSMDQGETWQPVSPPGSKDLDFRGIVAFSENTAYAMSSGEGPKSRIYKTSDGGKTWKLQLTGDRKEFFLDSIACASETRCLALGDPIDGKFTLLRTEDGQHWNSIPPENRPDALPGEGSFAASNSCLLTRTLEDFFFVTGGTNVEGKRGRVFHTTNSGKSWDVSEPPIAHGNASSGVFAIAADANGTIFIVGGDYKSPDLHAAVAAVSTDGGKTWREWTPQPRGFRSAVATLGDTIVTVGPNGSEISEHSGKNWQNAGDFPLNAVALRYNGGWAVGPNGAIARYVPQLELM